VRAALTDRLWAKVRKGPSCWEWTGALRNGYGAIGRGGRKDGVEYAHRLTYQWAHNTAIPKGMDILHACDNRKCVNPAHLSVGTRQANVDDMMAKGRHASQRRK
jgi:hypothetical protein